MSQYSSSIWSKAARQAFDTIEGSDWSCGISLVDLLERVNQVAKHFDSEGQPDDARVSQIFSPRSFRHYQTLGCIDVPERVGKRVEYGFRHFVQAVLIRALLKGRIPSDHMFAIMGGCSTAETKRMLLDGTGFTIYPSRCPAESEKHTIADHPVGIWKRIVITAGIEIHVLKDLQRLTAGEIREILSSLESTLRKKL